MLLTEKTLNFVAVIVLCALAIKQDKITCIIAAFLSGSTFYKSFNNKQGCSNMDSLYSLTMFYQVLALGLTLCIFLNVFLWKFVVKTNKIYVESIMRELAHIHYSKFVFSGPLDHPNLPPLFINICNQVPAYIWLFMRWNVMQCDFKFTNIFLNQTISSLHRRPLPYVPDEWRAP